VPHSGERDLHRLRIDRDQPPRRRRRLPVILGGVVLLAAVGLGLVVGRGGGLPGSRPAVETAVALRAAAAGGGGRTLLTANGYVQARRSAAVSAELQGRLVKLHVQEGSRVRRGEIIAELSSDDLQARLASAEAEVAVRRAAIAEARAENTEAENELARQRELHATGLATQAALEAAQARRDLVAARIASAGEALSAALAQRRVAAAELDKTRIRAPFDATVLRKDAEVGEMVAPVAMGGSGSRGAIVTLAALDSLDVEVDVNEAYIGRVRIGMPAEVVTDAYPDTSFAARVRQIVPTSDRQKATVLVKAEILRHDARLLPEMGAKVTFLAERDTLRAAGPRYVTVPDAAVQRDQDAAFVWLVRDDARLERRPVRTGAAAAGRTEIVSGLAGGEVVVLRASAALREGRRVRVP
jgi:RND family efflux transporter MFP subunit